MHATLNGRAGEESHRLENYFNFYTSVNLAHNFITNW